MSRPEVQAFCEKVRSNGRRVIQGHLFESEAEHEEEGAQQVLACRKEVERKKREAYQNVSITLERTRPENVPSITELY